MSTSVCLVNILQIRLSTKFTVIFLECLKLDIHCNNSRLRTCGINSHVYILPFQDTFKVLFIFQSVYILQRERHKLSPGNTIIRHIELLLDMINLNEVGKYRKVAYKMQRNRR